MSLFARILVIFSIGLIRDKALAHEEPVVIDVHNEENVDNANLPVPPDNLVENSKREDTGYEVGRDLDEPIANKTESTAHNTSNANATKAKVTCKIRNVTDANVSSSEVQIVNGTSLLNTLQDKSNLTATECVVVLFYAPWCNFSATAAPHYNALQRHFPNITCLAVDTLAYSGLCARFGIVAVPTILLFHNGHPVAKFNGTKYTVENFARFLNQYTGLEPVGQVNVTEADFLGPLPSTPSDDIDYHLWLAWCFILTCCLYGFSRSSICQQIVERIRNDWREAEAQHEHAE